MRVHIELSPHHRYLIGGFHLKFIYSRQDMPGFERAQENCYLLTNGLGGYSSLSAAFSMTRGDQGLLVSARTAPNDRVTLLARLQEVLRHGAGETFLSTQAFADETPREEGYLHLSMLTVEDMPRWVYDVRGVRITREVGVAYGSNAAAVRYTLDNRTEAPCTLTLRPFVLGFEKGHAPLEKWPVELQGTCICANGHHVHLRTDGTLTEETPGYALQAYMHDEPDGRPEKGLAASVCRIDVQVPPRERRTCWITFSDQAECPWTVQEMFAAARARMQQLRRISGLQDPVALQLASAADAYIARRESTGGGTILAGYPFFGDWGRDTMIALTGCCLSTCRYEDAKSILRTFLQYEKDGLVPNLFPEGTSIPMYNTVDAALLLVNVIWLYVEKTVDLSFVREAWPVLERIIAGYRKGTHHGIHMDADGLICAGQGFDQVTWMDVRIGDILPTPRHGKPVEINAYWYSALRIMDAFAQKLGLDRADYGVLAERVKASFLKEFWLEAGYLKDVVSGSSADTQLRCNQIWAVTQPFTMLSPTQEKAVVDAVYAHLYTPCGLRTLSPEDPQYHGVYAGPQKERDLAYHQGTVWPFLLGAYYLAHLKVYGDKAAVRDMLAPMEATLREGCIGQLPEIYDGDAPALSRGCFAQAWSVGEMLRVYEALER